MPWLSLVKGVVHAFYLGNECGDAIASILYGTANPSGRLSLTMPVRDEDIPAFPDFKSARTKVHYSEGIWVGYKYYNMRKVQPLFAFGHGLSYSSFEYSDLFVSTSDSNTYRAEDWKATVKVTVTNTGVRVGSHSVHVYLSPPPETDVSLKHPAYTLQGFDKVYYLVPGESRTVEISLDKCKDFTLHIGSR
jgi:beta-glucosidase